MSIEEQFHAAVKVIRSLPKNGSFQPSDELKLKFYAYFKQATEGPNTTKKPAFFDIVNRYKWDAWKKCENISKTEAMHLYVEELKKVVETLSLNEQVTDFLDILGPFYEFLPEEITNKEKTTNGLPVMKNGLESSENEVTTTTSLACFNSYDSEGDEFSDTYDTIPQQNKQIPVLHPKESVSDVTDSKENVPSVSSSKVGGKTVPTNQRPLVTAQLSNHVNVSTDHANEMFMENALGFSEQLTLAVFRLQHNLDRMTHRMESIEGRLNNSTTGDLSHKESKSKSVFKWPFQELSPKTTTFFIAWPFIAYFLINYMKQFRKK